MAIKQRLRHWLHRREWVLCDHGACPKLPRPRWLAMRQGWLCGGIAGFFDWCPRHHVS